MRSRATVLVLLYLLAPMAVAGEADVVDARATASGDGRYRVEVTVRHADGGWDHYADRWEVLAPNGEVLGTRVLHHPHVDEQPFTRSLSGVAVPAGVRAIRIRARDVGARLRGSRSHAGAALIPGTAAHARNEEVRAISARRPRARPGRARRSRVRAPR